MLWNECRSNQVIPLLFEILFSRHINMYSVMRQALHSIPTRCTVRLPMSIFTTHSANSPIVKLPGSLSPSNRSSKNSEKQEPINL